MIREGHKIKMRSEEGLILEGTVLDCHTGEYGASLSVVTDEGDEFDFEEEGDEWKRKGIYWYVVKANPCAPCIGLNPIGGGFVEYEEDRSGDEIKEFALKRWGPLSWRGKQDRDITWVEFARRIRASGDPGSRKVADALDRMPGLVRGFKVALNPRKKGSKIRWKGHTKGGAVVRWTSDQEIRAVIPRAQPALPRLGWMTPRPANIPGQFVLSTTGKGAQVRLRFLDALSHYRDSFDLGVYDTPRKGKEAAQRMVNAASNPREKRRKRSGKSDPKRRIKNVRDLVEKALK